MKKVELKDYFVSQEQAESLKELGFKDACLAYYREDELILKPSYQDSNIIAPLIIQAIDWLADELGVSVNNINDSIEKLKALRKKITITVTLTFEVYQRNKTYEDGNYLILLEDEDYPLSVCIAYGQMIDNNGTNYNDEYVAYISPSFVVF